MTTRVQEALQQAGGIATRRSHQGIDVEHLALALLAQQDGLAARLLEADGAPADRGAGLEKELDRLPQVKAADRSPVQGTFVTQRLTQLLVQAEDEAKRLKDEYV